MPLVTAIALYFVLWWIVLLAVLPLGTKPVSEADSQTGWRGAPERPRMLRKVVITSLVTAVVWLAIWLTVESNLISFRSGWLALPDR
jgi:predicted secreted protein